MKLIIKICAFLLANIAGFLSISLAFHLAQQYGKFAETTDIVVIASFFQNAMFALAAGAIISVGFFVMKGLVKYLCLAAPLISVMLYWLKLVLLSS